MPGATEAVKRLSKQHELYVITGRPQDMMEKTRSWLNKKFGQVFKDYLSTDYHIVNGGRLTKGKIAKRLGLDVHIDDFYKYALECLDFKIPVLLFSQAWNRSTKPVPGLTRVNSWEDITSEIYERKFQQFKSAKK